MTVIEKVIEKRNEFIKRTKEAPTVLVIGEMAADELMSEILSTSKTYPSTDESSEIFYGMKISRMKPDSGFCQISLDVM